MILHAKRVRRAFTEYNARELAQLSGISLAKMYRLERNEGIPTSDTFLKLLTTLCRITGREPRTIAEAIFLGVDAAQQNKYDSKDS